MNRNKKKIIRAITVSLSIDLFDEIMRKMRDEGYEMVAVTSPGPELDKLRDEEGFHCVGVPMERHISLVKDLKSLINMIRVFRKEKPHVVHSMTPKAGLICMIAAWLTRVPVRIHTFTGLVWPTAKGLSRKVLMLTDWITCFCATHVIPEGEGVKADLQAHITNKPMKVLGYGNIKGVDMKRFDASRFQEVAKSQKVSDIFTFLFVGRIVGDKGINELVEAFAKLGVRNEELGVKTKLVLVGRYETELDPISQHTQQLISNNENIIAAGAKYGDDLLKEYVKADCFVMPSYREGFPNTVLEAGAMGLPSIVTDINGSREVVCGTSKQQKYRNTEFVSSKINICKNGIVIPSKNVDNLYEAMEMMLNSWSESKNIGNSESLNENMYLSMKENARPMIESRFEQSFVQKCLMDFYKEILK